MDKINELLRNIEQLDRADRLSKTGWLALFISIYGIIILLVCGCQRTLNVEHFDDIVLEIIENDKNVSATGLKGIYVLAGTYQEGGLKASAGELIKLGVVQHQYFPIRELLERNPQAATLRTVAAADKQEKDVLKFLSETP